MLHWIASTTISFGIPSGNTCQTISQSDSLLGYSIRVAVSWQQVGELILPSSLSSPPLQLSVKELSYTSIYRLSEYIV